MHGTGQKSSTLVPSQLFFCSFVCPDPFSHCAHSSKPCPGAADGVSLLSDKARLYWEHQNIPPRLPGNVQHLTGCILVLLSFISWTVNDWWEKTRNLIGFRVLANDVNDLIFSCAGTSCWCMKSCLRSSQTMTIIWQVGSCWWRWEPVWVQSLWSQWNLRFNSFWN